MGDYPEHTKLSAVSKESQAIGSFLEWLQEQGVNLAKYHQHTDACQCDCDWHDLEVTRSEMEDFTGCPQCGGSTDCPRMVCGFLVSKGAFGHDELAPIHRTITQWLELYFEIDGNKLEEEKREMLDSLRAANSD